MARAPSPRIPRSALGTYFGVTPETWLSLQLEYDLRVARRAAGDEIARVVRQRDAA